MRFALAFSALLAISGCDVVFGLERSTTTTTDAIAATDAPLQDAFRRITLRSGLDGYAAVADTYVDAKDPSIAHGTLVTFSFDKSPLRYALLRFDGIPLNSGAQVAKAVLSLTVVNGGGSGGRMHEAKTSWSNDSTYDTVALGAGALGTDVCPAPGSTGAYECDVTASVQRWVTQPDTNLGWIMVSAGTDGTDVVSSESSTLNERPTLVIEAMDE